MQTRWTDVAKAVLVFSACYLTASYLVLALVERAAGA